ncbi:M16 family metallopeptidase [Chloroflexota bacterium]
MYHRSTLDNGLRIISARMPHIPSVSVNFFVGVGSRYEGKAEAGISHFIEHILFRGTAKRQTSREISEAIEGVGGSINAATDKELTYYWCKVAKHHFPLALDVLSDMVMHPKLDPKDIEMERQIITEEISRCKDSPSQKVSILVDELLWPDHPLGRDIAGDKKSVAAISRKKIANYITTHYQPNNVVVAVAGDIKHDQIVSAVSQSLGGWANQQPRLEYLTYTEKRVTRQLHIEKQDTEQAHLCLALPGLSLSHPQRFTLDLLNVIIGEGMSSRLFVEIRDKLGLAYSINSYTDHFLDCGSLIIYAGVEPKKLQTAIKAILTQLSLLHKTIPESELSKAKEQAKGRLLLQMENSRNVAGWAGGQEILTDRTLSIEKVTSIIDAITAAEIKQLAEELLVASRLRLVVVGPFNQDEPLAKLLKL